jgi:hypothetical protein
MDIPLRNAAANLGKIWYGLEVTRSLPMDSWIFPEKDNSRLIRPLLFAYVDSIDNPDVRFRSNLSEPRLRYARDYNLVIPRLETAATRWLATTLSRERDVVEMIGQRLLAPGAAARLHEMAVPVMRAVRGKEAGPASPDRQSRESLGTFIDRLQRNRLVWATSKVISYSSQDAELFRVLVQHPGGVDIIDAFNESATAGLDAALPRVSRAIQSMVTFGRDIAESPDHLWRYPPVIIGGAGALGIADVPLFCDFAMALRPVLARTWLDRALDAASVVLLCVGLVTGPIGAAVIGLLDLAIAGTTTVAAYVREREQEMAAGSLAFSAQKNRLADQPTYRDTLMSGANALVTSWMAWKGVTHAISDLGRKSADRAAGAARIQAFEEAGGRAESRAAAQVADVPPFTPPLESVGARGVGSEARGTAPAARLPDRGTPSATKAGSRSRMPTQTGRGESRAGQASGPAWQRRTAPEPSARSVAAAGGASADTPDAIGRGVDLSAPRDLEAPVTIAGSDRRGTRARKTADSSVSPPSSAGVDEFNNRANVDRLGPDSTAARGLTGRVRSNYRLSWVRYGESSLSRFAQEVRLQKNLRRGGNIAVVDFEHLPDDFVKYIVEPVSGNNFYREGNRLAIVNFSGFDHSEELAFKLIVEGRGAYKLNPKRLYSEFNPCKERCSPLLRREFPGLQVEYSFIYDGPRTRWVERDQAVDELFARHDGLKK